MAREKNSIRSEVVKLVKKRVEPSYVEKLGVVENGKRNINVLQAIALAQIKKGLEGDLKAAMYIDQLLSDDGPAEQEAAFDIVVKVLGENDEI